MKTTRWNRGVVVLGLSLLWNGWLLTAAKAQTAGQEAATARVVVYRPYKFTGLPMQYALLQDSLELGRLRNGRYLTSTVPAGMVTLRSHVVGILWPVQRERVLRFPAQAGATYYVQTDVSWWMTTMTMAVVPADFAEAQLRQ
jgi:hypothetical protein